jgi:hypothetical protein
LSLRATSRSWPRTPICCPPSRYAAIEVTMIAMAMLALSSLSTNSRFVGILYTGSFSSPRPSATCFASSPAAPRCRGFPSVTTSRKLAT